MTNPDDTSPSDSGAEQPPNDDSDSRSDLDSTSPQTGEETESNGDDSGFSLPSPDQMGSDDEAPEASTSEATGDEELEALESPTGDTAEDEFEEIPADAIETAEVSEEMVSEESDGEDSDDSKETMLGGYQAQNLDSEQTSPEESSEEPSPGDPASDEQEVLDVDEHDDLIIEEEEADQAPTVEAGAFEQARQEDEDSVVVGDSDAEYDMGPTVVSEEHLAVEEDDLDDAGEDDPTGAGGLGDIAEEMQAAEEAGELAEASDVESGDATVEERDTHQGTGEEDLGAVSGGLGDLSSDPEDPTIVDEGVQPGDLEEAAGPGDSREGGGSGGLHGEGSLNVDEEVAADDFEYDEYEKTAIREEGFDFDDSSIPGAPEAESPPDAGGVRSDPPPADRGVPGADDTPMREGGASPEPAGADEAGDFESQKTSLFDPSEEEETESPRLEVISGPAEGDDFEFDGSRVVAGRSTDNDVVIPDEAMSREHFELVEEADGTFTIRDLDSVNGTIVNGRLIEEADLLPGDRIETGNTTFELVVPGASPERDERDRETLSPGRDAAEAHQPRHGTRTGEGEDGDLTKWLNRVIVAAVALMVPLAAVFVWFLATDADRPTEAELQEMKRAREAYLAGVDAQRDREWKTAAKELQRAENLDPDLPRLGSRLERVEMERGAASKLEEARQAQEEGRHEEALELAESIPEESSYRSEARRIVGRERRRTRIAELESEAREKLDAGAHGEAREAVRELLEIAPTHTAALALRSRILHETDLQVEREEEAPEDADEEETTDEEEKTDEQESVAAREPSSDEGSEPTSEGTTAANRDDDSSGGGGTESSWLLDSDDEDDSEGSGGGGAAPTGDIDFQRGFALYNQERFDQAISHFEQAARSSSGSVADRASRVADGIRNFQHSYQAAQSSMQSGQWDRAARQYRKALSADKSVASAQYFESKINSEIARAKAKRGMQHLESGSPGKAYDSYRSARQYDSSHGDVRSLLRKLKKKADSLYVQAKAKRKTDPGRAASLCRTIMTMVPKNSDAYQKAQELLDEI